MAFNPNNVGNEMVIDGTITAANFAILADNSNLLNGKAESALNVNSAATAVVSNSALDVADDIITTAKIKNGTLSLQSDTPDPVNDGWRINENGDSVFNNLIARGTVQSNTADPATDGWIINQAGTAIFNSMTARGTVNSTVYSAGVSGWEINADSPSGDDEYGSIGEAIEDLSRSFMNFVDGGVSVTIFVESGYTVTENLNFKNINTGWIAITGEGGVPVVTNSSDPIFSIEEGAIGPYLMGTFTSLNIGGELVWVAGGTIFGGDLTCNSYQIGVYLDNGGSCMFDSIHTSGGIYGLWARGNSSVVTKYPSSFNGDSFGVVLTGGSNVRFDTATFTNTTLSVGDNSSFSSGTLSFTSSSYRSISFFGVTSGAVARVNSITISDTYGPSLTGIAMLNVIGGGSLYVSGISIESTTQRDYGILLDEGLLVSTELTEVADCTYGVRVLEGSVFRMLNTLTVSDASYALYVLGSSKVQATNLQLDQNSNTRSIYCKDSEIIADTAVLEGRSGGNALDVNSSKCIFGNVTITGTSVAPGRAVLIRNASNVQICGGSVTNSPESFDLDAYSFVQNLATYSGTIDNDGTCTFMSA
jgi:hypothetical protein